MKSLLVIALVFGLTSTTNNAVSASPLPHVYNKNTVFDTFNAHRQHNSVALVWTTAGSGISTFVIQHSFDGVSFTTVDQVSPEADGRNGYLHDGAFPGYNYYRIGAILSDGSTEYSDIEVVRIVRRR